MSKTIEFYFDFSSPYGYFASCLINDLAARHRHDVLWRPYLLGAAFRLTQRRPMVEHPMVGDYVRYDCRRIADMEGIDFKLPDPFPIMTAHAGRIFYWIEDESADKAVAFAQATLRAYFADGIDISAKQNIVDIAAGLGHDAEAVMAALDNPGVKEKFKKITDDAINNNVFGSPFFVVGQEHFWGYDRLHQLDRWLGR